MRQHNGFLLAGSVFFGNGLPIYVNRAEENFEMRFHFHDFVEITYVAEGKGFHHVGGATLPAARGDLFVIPKGVSHVFRPGSADPGIRLRVYNALLGDRIWEMIRSFFSGEDGVWNRVFALGTTLPGQPDTGGGTEDGWIMLRNSGEQMNSLFQEFHYAHRTGEQGRQALLLSYAVRLLVMIDRGLRQKDQREEQEEGLSLSGILDHIRMHCGEPLGIKEMARRCGLSERHFFRLFKERTGQTFAEYVQAVRMNEACRLLRDTDLKIMSVAEAVGYRDTDSFYRVFKVMTGYTPGQYRKSRGK